ncbi:MAG: glycosyltransferase [Tannerellaceae bacterium]
MHTIDILLATFNGELFIKEQIDSIISQTYSDWILYIRDDGSSDNTLNIIKEYQLNEPRIVLIEDTKTCCSAELNFAELLKYSTSQFLCFCDQDDIWLKNKLELMYSYIQTLNQTLPIVIFSDGYLYMNDHQIDNSKRLLSAQPRSLKDTLFCNGGIHGSMSMFNSKMRELMLYEYNYLAMHDHLLTLIGCAFNSIYYLPIPTFLYRQHENNVTPHVRIGFFKKVLYNFKSRTTVSVVDRKHYKGVAAFYTTIKHLLSDEDSLLCELYLSYPSMDPFVRFISIFRHKFSIENSRVKLLMKILVKSQFIK